MQQIQHFYTAQKSVAVLSFAPISLREKWLLSVNIERTESLLKLVTAALALLSAYLLISAGIGVNDALWPIGFILSVITVVFVAKAGSSIDDAKIRQNMLCAQKLRTKTVTERDPSYPFVARSRDGIIIRPKHDVIKFLSHKEVMKLDYEYRSISPDDWEVPKFAEILRIDVKLRLLFLALTMLNRRDGLRAQIAALEEERQKVIGEIHEEHRAAMAAHAKLKDTMVDSVWLTLNLEHINRGRFISKIASRYPTPSQ